MRYLAGQPLPFCFDLLLHFFIKAPDFSVMVCLLPAKGRVHTDQQKGEYRKKTGGEGGNRFPLTAVWH